MPLITAGPNLFVGPILQLLALSQITSEEIRLARPVAEDLCSPFEQ